MPSKVSKKRAAAGPRVLVVTPEISYVPIGMGNFGERLRAKAGGLADVSASLVSALFDLGVDVHVALPHYRRMFSVDVGRLISDELRVYKSKLPESRIHLAEDRIFYYREEVYGDARTDNNKLGVVFQREVINNIIPSVRPDLIHCNDWMTGLIPAMARRLDIPCLFTIHNIHTIDMRLAAVEDLGIDAAEFWHYLFFRGMPGSYEVTRNSVPVDFLTSGIFASHFVNTVSPTFLHEVCDGHHSFVPDYMRRELANKRDAGCAVGILNAPDASYNPGTDKLLARRYTPATHVEGKRGNKKMLQDKLGLSIDPNAPLLFWPSRLDPIQKGPQLLAEIMETIVRDYAHLNLQILSVANGPYQNTFRDIVRISDLHRNIAVCDFDEELSHLGFAASDFMLMPSRFEPCGLPQMISSIYGSLPIVHDTGGLHDTVFHLNSQDHSGNGFVFKFFDSAGLRWAIDQAMDFYQRPPEIKQAVVKRVMQESVGLFTHAVTAGHYVELYEKMLHRPLVKTF